MTWLPHIHPPPPVLLHQEYLSHLTWHSYCPLIPTPKDYLNLLQSSFPLIFSLRKEHMDLPWQPLELWGPSSTHKTSCHLPSYILPFPVLSSDILYFCTLHFHILESQSLCPTIIQRPPCFHYPPPNKNYLCSRFCLLSDIPLYYAILPKLLWVILNCKIHQRVKSFHWRQGKRWEREHGTRSTKTKIVRQVS